jgi:hypothetical protein
MIQIILLALGLVISEAVLASQTLICTHFIYQDIPFITISMTIDDSGRIDRLAEIDHYGTSRQTTVEENQTAPKQLYNLTIEADNPGNELFLEIYRTEAFEVSSPYKAKLINPGAPSVKEMAGICQIS